VVLDLFEIVEQSGQRWEFPVDYPPAPTPDLTYHGSASGTIVVYHTGEELVFNGTVSTAVDVECVRCLERHPHQVVTELDTVIPTDTVRALLLGKPVEMEPDLAAALSAEGVDLAELIRQAVVVALPMQFLCSEDCRGLCAQCGCNLNDRQCQCHEERVDSRLQVLANWGKQ